MLNRKPRKTLNRLPNYVHNIDTATCVFCPYGADVKVGDRVLAFDERTSAGRLQRERLVEVTAVKRFRATGRFITLEATIAKDEEIARIAEDSEVSVQMLYDHQRGKATYIEGRSPVVVYFEPCDIMEPSIEQSKQRSSHIPRLVKRG
ncbi:MAG: hypothetical protein ACM3ZT_04770 [Bacillota bacterium]